MLIRQNLRSRYRNGIEVERKGRVYWIAMVFDADPPKDSKPAEEFDSPETGSKNLGTIQCDR